MKYISRHDHVAVAYHLHHRLPVSHHQIVLHRSCPELETSVSPVLAHQLAHDLDEPSVRVYSMLS